MLCQAAVQLCKRHHGPQRCLSSALARARNRWLRLEHDNGAQHHSCCTHNMQRSSNCVSHKGRAEGTGMGHCHTRKCTARCEDPAQTAAYRPCTRQAHRFTPAVHCTSLTLVLCAGHGIQLTCHFQAAHITAYLVLQLSCQYVPDLHGHGVMLTCKTPHIQVIEMQCDHHSSQQFPGLHSVRGPIMRFSLLSV